MVIATSCIDRWLVRHEELFLHFVRIVEQTNFTFNFGSTSAATVGALGAHGAAGQVVGHEGRLINIVGVRVRVARGRRLPEVSVKLGAWSWAVVVSNGALASH